jgi:hypothetical protein
MNKSSLMLTNSRMEVPFYQFKYRFLFSEVPLPRANTVPLEDNNQEVFVNDRGLMSNVTA